MPAATKKQADPGARQHPGESRWAATGAMLVAVLLYTFLPSPVIFLPRWIIPALELVLVIPLLVGNPMRFTNEARHLRWVSLSLLGVIAIANITSLVMLVHELVTGAEKNGGVLLLGAGQVWLTNMIVFGTAYWEMDRGGPVARTQRPRSLLPAADFRFPQDEDHDAVTEVAARSSVKSDWSPGYLDYLYVSVTNSSAFSPTDTMPLSHRAKMLMSAESVSALVLSVLVISRAVSLLG